MEVVSLQEVSFRIIYAWGVLGGISCSSSALSRMKACCLLV